LRLERKRRQLKEKASLFVPILPLFLHYCANHGE